MSERPSGIGRWILLGRMLPRRTRTRVFEPAFYDLLKRLLQSSHSSTLRMGGSTLALLAGSYAEALKHLLLSRWTIVLGTMLLLLFGAIVFLQEWLGHLYAHAAGS